MICRGFKGDFVMIDHFKLKQKDYLFIIVSSLFLIFLLAIEKGLI